MSQHRFIWVDAFTATRFGGNPCAVVFGAEDLDQQARIAFTRETGLVECAFLQPSAVADFGVRYYTPARALPMAGHPTIATVVALLDAGMIAAPCDFMLEVGGGPIAISVRPDPSGGPDLISFTTHKPRFGAEHAPEAIAPLLGLSPQEIDGVPQTVDVGGTRFCVTLLSDKDALRRAALDLPAHHAVQESAACDFFEPYLATLGGVSPAGDTFSRLLLAPPEPPEDPFTGSATACLAAYLWKRGLMGLGTERMSFQAEQGHWLGRPGGATAEVAVTGGDLEAVIISGRGVVAMRGEAMI